MDKKSIAEAVGLAKAEIKYGSPKRSAYELAHIVLRLAQENERYRRALEEITNTVCSIGCLDGRTVCEACIARQALKGEG